ncbi:MULTISPECIES: hypothetical protein [Clostridium]|uniref:hypothetical protein n=1 Tax=Clostridium TaxID=1485 RepID=UPI00019B0851|nr:MULTISPECIES: hypothetical protein [Clostridium]EEH99706.1 hypothetical protein CSBG_03332 [Clostridium sp. 7_2_43FAA]
MFIKNCSKCNNLEPGYYKGIVINYKCISKDVIYNDRVLIKSNMTVEIEGRLLKEQSVSVILENMNLVSKYEELMNEEVVFELDYDYEYEDGTRLKVEGIYDISEWERLIKEQEEYRAYESVGLDDYTISLVLNKIN